MRKQGKKSNKQNSKKSDYRGPYQSNPNLVIQNVKKSMRPEAEGPTIDTFSELDSTTNMLPNEENDIRYSTEIKRPTKEKRFSISKENVILSIIGFVAAGIGVIVYTHSNKLVSIEKDIDYLKEGFKEQKVLIYDIDDKTDKVDRKLDLLEQKINLNIKNNNL